MKRKPDLIYTSANYIWWFILGNIFFLLVNIPIISVLIFESVTGNFKFNLTTFVAMLFIGPALVALLSIMGKLVREKDIKIMKDFFKAYKSNFFEGVFYWGIFQVAISILYFDIHYVNTKLEIPMLKYIFIAIGIVLVTMLFYIFTIISRFYFSIKDVIKLSLYYSITRIKTTIFNWVYLVAFYIVMYKIPNIIFQLSGWSIFAYLIMMNVKDVLDCIEANHTIK